MGLVILVAALVIASLTDVAHRKIPNAITYPLAAFGLIFHLLSSGMAGVVFSLSGILVGGGLLLLLYLLGGMGAGDVKLMAAVGSILGPADVFTASLYSALVGGVYALAIVFRHGELRETVYWLAPALGGMMPARTAQAPEVAGRAGLPRLCYGLAISLGTVLAVLRPL
ncbi:MAG TPA: A24 family peptidase [Syntrophales bacterium]|nr:A24 family peptidase [Syntrophales bacterium]